MATFAKAPKAIRSTPSVVDRTLASARNTKFGKVLGSDTAAGREIGRQIGLNVGKTKLGVEAPILTPTRDTWSYSMPLTGISNNPNYVYRTGAKNFYRLVGKGKISLDDPHTSVVEIRSTPEGAATVKPRHMVERNPDGSFRDITFTYGPEDAASGRLLQ